MLMNDRMLARKPLLRLQNAWLVLMLILLARFSHAVLTPADKQQLVTLLHSCQPGFQAPESDPCSAQGLAELLDAGVTLTCTPAARATQVQRCQRIVLDGEKHTGSLVSLPVIQFPALVEFEVKNTMLINGLPSALDTPKLQLLSFTNNTKLRSSLPSEWGASIVDGASFPELRSLHLEHGLWEGTLPPEWGGNVSFPNLLNMIITGPRAKTSPNRASPNRGLTGGIPSEWLAPGSFSRLQTMDLSYNSLSGKIPNSLMGISERGPTTAQIPFPNLSSIKASMPNILRFLKSQATPISFPASQTCGASTATESLLRSAGRQLADHTEWLAAGIDTLLDATPFFLFPWGPGEQPQEAFIGLCDLPEMLSLADALRFDVTPRNATCEATLNYCQWPGVMCGQSRPPSAHVQSITVVSDALHDDLNAGRPLPKRDEASRAYLPTFARSGALPSLEHLFLDTEVWGVLPDSWASDSQLGSLKSVHLLGDNFIHALSPGWFEQSTQGMDLLNLTVATVSTIGCLPENMLSAGKSLQLVPAPSFQQFPSSQKAVACPIPAFPSSLSDTAAERSDDPYSALKQMQVLRLHATSSVLHMVSLGCSTDRMECPVNAPGADCSVQLQELEVNSVNLCGEGYLPTRLGCSLCGSGEVPGCQDSCDSPPDQMLCRWRGDACDERMTQLISRKVGMQREAYTLALPAAAREIESGVYALALSAALAAAAQQLSSPLVGRPRVQGLIMSSGRSDCRSGAKVVASLTDLEQALPSNTRLADALQRPSLLLAPVLCGSGSGALPGAQMQEDQIAVLTPPGVPATHVVVEVDTINCADAADCMTAGRKLLDGNVPVPHVLEPILQDPTTADVLMRSLLELSEAANLDLSAESLAAKDLLPQHVQSGTQGAGNQNGGGFFSSDSVLVRGMAGGIAAVLAAFLCSCCVCLQRRRARESPSVADYVEISASRALPSTTTTIAGAMHTEASSDQPSGPETAGPETVRSKMSWLKGLARSKRQHGAPDDRLAWTKLDHLLSVMACGSRSPANMRPDDDNVPSRPTAGQIISNGIEGTFNQTPPAKLHREVQNWDIGHHTHERRAPAPSDDPSVAVKQSDGDQQALSALVLRVSDANKHAALRVASAYDSLFSGDPFGIYRTSPFQTPLWEILLSYRREQGPFKEHMLPARRFHCVGKGGFESSVAELQELQKNRLAVIYEFRCMMCDPMLGVKLQRASTSGVPLSASSLHPGTPLAHVDEEHTSDVQNCSDNSHGEGDSTKAGSVHISPQLSAVGSLTPAATAPPGRLPSSMGSGGLSAHRAHSATPPGKLPRHIMIGESGPLSEDKVNQREKQYLDIIGQRSFPGQLPRPGSASLPSVSTPEIPVVPTSISHVDDPVNVTYDSSTDAPAAFELPRMAADPIHALKASTVRAPISRSFSWPYCQALASMDFQALARDEDGFLRNSAAQEEGKYLDEGVFLGPDPRHPTVLIGSVYFVGDRQKARLNKEAENAKRPYKPPDRVMGAPQPSTELPAVPASGNSRHIAGRTNRLQGATDKVAADTSADISRLAHSVAMEWRNGGDSYSSLTTPPSRSATMHAAGASSRVVAEEQVTSHSGLLAKLSNAFASREHTTDQHHLYIPPDGLEDGATSAQNSAGPSQRVQPQDDAALIQQALQMCDTDKMRESLGATGGVAWAAAGTRTDTAGAAPPGPGGYMKLEDVMNGRLSHEPGAAYPASGGPQAAIEPPDKVSVRYDQHSEAGLDTAFNVLLECFGMMQWQGPAKEIAVSMLEDLKSHVSAQNENRSIFDERLDLGDLDMTSFRAEDEELGPDIVEPPAAQAEDRNKNAHLGLGLGKLTPLAEDSESDEVDGNHSEDEGQVVLPPRMPGPPDRDMNIDPSKLTYISLLGRGAFGEVHYGTWEAPDGQVHDVAIKVLLATRYGSLQECDKDRKKFVTEMQLMMRMTHHSIVRCFGGAMAKRDGENDFMVLEYIPGGTLDHYVHDHRRNSRLTLGEVLVIATDLADVLRYLHKLHVVHQDLKPSNILLNEHGEVKLTDFGISKIKRSTCLSQCMVGTPSYTAPEVWVGEQVNEKCDIFALGILLWECMTGTRPFKNMHAFQIMMHLQTNQKRGEDWLPFPKQTPPEFKRLVRRCWHAENRFRISADEALASAVLLRSTISDALQSVPVELDVGLLPDNHTQGVLIPSNGMSRKNNKNASKRRNKVSPNSSLQVSGNVNVGKPVLSHDLSASGGRQHPSRSVRTERRMYGRAETNVYVPSSPTRSRDNSGPQLQQSAGPPASASDADSTFRPPMASHQPPNPADPGNSAGTGEASGCSWADWSIQDPNSKAIKYMWNIGFGGDTTSNLGHGSTFAVGAGMDSAMSGASERGIRSGPSNARLKQPVSTSSAQGRPAVPSRMPAVLESGQHDSAGSKELDTHPATLDRGDTGRHASSAADQAGIQGSAFAGGVQMADLGASLRGGSGSGAKPAVTTSPLASPAQMRGSDSFAPLMLTACRAKSRDEDDPQLAEDLHLPLPVPTANNTTVQITDSAALPASLPASGQLSHTRQLSHPLAGLGGTKAKNVPRLMPWVKTTSHTDVSDVDLLPSVIDENSKQALAVGPSIADAWKAAQAGGLS